MIFTLLLQKPRMPQIQSVQGRSRSILLRALGNEGDGASSAFPPGKKHERFFICFRSHQKFIYELCLNVFKCPIIILFFYTLSCFYVTAGFIFLEMAVQIECTGVDRPRAAGDSSDNADQGKTGTMEIQNEGEYKPMPLPSPDSRTLLRKSKTPETPVTHSVQKESDLPDSTKR